MLGWFLNDFARPIGRRLGTALGAFLSAQGVAADDISVLVAAVPIAVGIVFDLTLRRFL